MAFWGITLIVGPTWRSNPTLCPADNAGLVPPLLWDISSNNSTDVQYWEPIICLWNTSSTSNVIVGDNGESPIESDKDFDWSIETKNLRTPIMLQYLPVPNTKSSILGYYRRIFITWYCCCHGRVCTFISISPVVIVNYISISFRHSSPLRRNSFFTILYV